MDVFGVLFFKISQFIVNDVPMFSLISRVIYVCVDVRWYIDGKEVLHLNLQYS